MDVTKHSLVPKHTILSENQKKSIMEQYNATPKKFPLIRTSDAALLNLKAKQGDMIKIERKSPTAGIAIYYRIVVEG